MAGRGKPKGSPKTGGRKAGVPNSTTAEIKTAIMRAYRGKGGDAALIKWARSNETEFYRLWAKLLPREIKADVNVTAGLIERIKQAEKRVKDGPSQRDGDNSPS